MNRQLSIPEQHQLRIARKTLTMNPVMVSAMGGMSIDEAKTVIQRLTDTEDDLERARR